MLRMSILAVDKEEMARELNVVVCNGMPLYPHFRTLYRYLVSMPLGRLSPPKLSEIPQQRCKVLIINALGEEVKNLP